MHPAITTKKKGPARALVYLVVMPGIEPGTYGL